MAERVYVHKQTVEWVPESDERSLDAAVRDFMRQGHPIVSVTIVLDPRILPNGKTEVRTYHKDAADG